jgi:hypothetical protein
MPNPMPAAEDDRQLPLVPLKYAGGARQQCDGSTTLTVGPLMLDGETRDRGAAGAAAPEPPKRRRGGLWEPGRPRRRNDRKGLPAADLRRLERRAEQSAPTAKNRPASLLWGIGAEAGFGYDDKVMERSR